MSDPVDAGDVRRDRIVIEGGTTASRELTARIATAIACCERLNLLPYADQDAIRGAWTELTGQVVDASFRLIPPFRTDHGVTIRVGRRVFLNHGTTINDIGGVTLGDDVMLGPNVSLLTSGHPVAPQRRTRTITAAPITIGSNVWIGAGATVLQGVTVGDDAVVAAGAVVTRDVAPATLVAGVPARLVRDVR